jgi:predicted Zn-dependent protease
MSDVMQETDVATRVLDLVRSSAGSAVDAEVVVEQRELSLTRFANSYIHQNVADATTSVRLRVHADGRTAGTSTTVLDRLDDLVTRTLAAMRLAPADPTWPGLTPPTPVGFSGNADPETASAVPAERAARVRAFIEAAQGLSAAGYCSTASTRLAYANSTGHHAFGATTHAAMDGIARNGLCDGLARLASVRLADVDGGVLGARAAAKARAGADPVELPPGRYEVVLEATAVADVLQMLAVYGFNGKAVLERRSFVELGVAQFDPAITLIDDAAEPDTIVLPFDAEGTPRQRLTLVDEGVSTAVAHDRRTAARAGVESTGHAVVGGAVWGAVPASTRLVPNKSDDAGLSEVDGPAADSSVLALVTGVERGLLVTDNHYTRVLDPRTLVVTGLTRNGVWLIEDGKITTPVQNFRFTQSYPQALAPGAVLGVGTHAVVLPGMWTEASFVAPTLRLASWNYTGGASG